MMEKNEGRLLESWAVYHADLFGAGNLTIFDNGSDDLETLAALDRVAAMGVHVRRDRNTRADFENKGEVLRDAAQDLHIRSPKDFVFFLDCDEFLAHRPGDTETVSLAGCGLYSALEALRRDGSAKFIGGSYLNNPFAENRFSWMEERKCFFEGGTIVSLGTGFHHGISTNSEESSVPEIVHLHFRLRQHDEMLRFSKAKLSGRVANFSEAALQSHKARRGKGHHLVDFLLEDAGSYRTRLAEFDWITIDARAKFDALGIPYPHLALM